MPAFARTWTLSVHQLRSRLSLAWQARRVLMSAFAEAASKPLASETLDSPNLSRRRSAADKACCQRWRRPSSSKVSLLRLILKRRCLNTEQPHISAFTPIFSKQLPNLLEDFIVELRGRRQ